MSDGFDAEVTDNASKQLNSAYDAMRGSLKGTASALATGLLTVARDEASGQMLEVHSGHFLASLSVRTIETDHGIDVELSSSSPLAGIFERGATIPAFTEMASARDAMHFDGRAGEVFAKVVHFPGARIAPRPILHTALEVMSGRIVEDLQAVGRKFAKDASA